MPDITMPQLGETVTEGTITKWFKKVGEEVKEDEPLFEVSTDKVDSEVPSTASGYLAEILVEEGDTVDVGAKLAVISDEAPSGGDSSGGDKAEPEAEAEAEAEDKAEDKTEAKAEPSQDEESQDEDGADEAPSEEAQTEPVAEDAETRPPRAEAEAGKARQQSSSDGGSNGDSPPASGGGGGAEVAAGKRTGGKLLSPVVRKLINENSLDPDQIEGTGQDGRITRADVLAYLDRNGGRSKGPQPVTSAGQTPQAPPAPAAPDRDRARAEAREKPAPAAKEAPATKRAAPMAPAAAGADDEVIAFSNIRRRTAEHMIRSQATSAHVLVATEVDYNAVDKARKAVKNEFKEKEGFSLTYLPFIARAVIDAMDEFPHVNASVGDNELIVHRRINLGIAVDINFEGLIVPVVRDADQLRLRALARSMADLARRARSRELSADDISGGTFTITNPGPFGTFLTYAVINQPQVAILSTDGIRKRPVAIELPDGTDAVVVRPVGMLGLSFDHRAFDGAYASAFIARVKEILETRDWLAEV